MKQMAFYMKKTIDAKTLHHLAYDVQEGLSKTSKTVLTISSFSNEDYTLLQNSVFGFYYPENPLLGKRIFENQYAAIYERSEIIKPLHFPNSYGLLGEGLVFSGFQVRGSFLLPLVICNHRYKTTDDRERNEIYIGTVIDMLLDIVDIISADACLYLLEKLEPYWYNYPKTTRDVDSWYSLIRKLVRKINYYKPELVCDFIKKHSNLVVVEQPTNQYMQNKKNHALRWMKQNLPNAKPVQDSFNIFGFNYFDLQICHSAKNT